MAEAATESAAAEAGPGGSSPAWLSTSPAIHVSQLTKRYGQTVALAGLSMSVPRGEVFGFLGPNGAGKTTVVKLLLGLAQPSSGEGLLLGSPLGSLDARRAVGYLPELFRYQGWLKAREVLMLHCRLAQLERSSWPEAIKGALATVGLSDRADDRVAGFSKGMQQRLGLGVALLGKPQLVLLDEPTSALDPVGRHDVREIVRGLRERGVAVFLNSHLLSEVEQVCDRVAVVDHGRVIAAGRLDELLARPQVRVRCTGLEPQAQPQLNAFGVITFDEGWLTVSGIDPGRVPDLVSAIIEAGGRVYAVDPGQQTLEERFLQLIEAA
ncbi:MAG TPA: ABC transporter ATP-binding protein [Candidatus Dormibacteraeota bacterium]|nr:ABC transporter ATP-binding protein [Candidatus Dormibacteraeota bacterium]